MEQIENIAATIDNKGWRDKTYRELAKSYITEGYTDKAINLIAKIETPDTKAMTIRGIGMAAADQKWDSVHYVPLFEKLTIEAQKIKHEPSHAIAFTYIAMAQAFAGDDNGAKATAQSIKNDALRNKAYGETAEIQAERGEYGLAISSIAPITSESFRNKAYATIAKIFTKKSQLDKAYKAAQNITNPYNKAQALQNILNHGNPEETPVAPGKKSH